MSTTPRPPLLSVEKLVDEFCEVHPFHAQLYAKQSACWVRDHYEDLITDGKLRVVEEVESVPTIQGVTMSAKCSGCGLKPLMFNFAYCPGCGNKIKR